MNRGLRFWGLFGVGAAGLLAGACSNMADDCENILCAGGTGTGAAGTGGAGGGGAQGGAGGSGGQGGGVSAGCTPSELEPGEAPADSCGAFVSSSNGADTNGGTKNAPYATLSAAIAAGASVIYACTDGFDEAVTLPAGTSLFGGLDCADGWAYVGGSARSPLTADADTIPLTLEAGASTSRIEDMAVTARSAEAAGRSSIALLASGASATIRRSSFTAGDGAAGENAPADSSDPSLTGAAGEAGTNGCTGAGGTIAGRRAFALSAARLGALRPDRS